MMLVETKKEPLHSFDHNFYFVYFQVKNLDVCRNYNVLTVTLECKIHSLPW